MTAAATRPLWQRLGAPVAGAAAAFVAGLALAVVGGMLGVVAMLALPAVAAAGLLTLARPLAAIGLVLGSLPIGLVALPGVPFGLQVVHLAVLLLSGVVLLRRVAAGDVPLRSSRPLLWAVALLAWAGLATLTAADTQLAVKQVANLAVGVLVAFVTVTVVRDLADARRLGQVLMAAGSAITVPSLLSAGQLSSAYGGAVVSNRLQGTFSQPNELGAFSMVLVVVGFALLLGARSRLERMLLSAALLASVGTLGLSLSRGAWIGTVLAGAALLVLLPAARRALLVAGVPLVLAAVALGAFAPDQPQIQVVGERIATLRDPGGNPYDGRPRIWAEARREVRLEPVTGHGPGAFPLVSTRAASAAQTVRADHAHNVLLTLAAEAGLPAAALLVGFTLAVGYAVRDTLRGPLDYTDKALVAGLAAACIGVAGQGLVDFVQRNAVLLITDWVVVGLVLAAARVRPRG